MRCFRFLVCIGWWLLATAACAASSPDTAAIVIRRLPADVLLLAKGWRYHAGDDPAWAQPDFDDSRWDTLSPLLPRQVQPRAVQAGVSWLRLRFRLGDSLRQREMLVTLQEVGAIEVYLNGRLLQRQGVLAADPARVVPRGRYLLPGVIPAGGPAEQVLAVRYAPWQPLLPRGLDQSPHLRVALVAPQQYWELREQQRGSAGFYLVLLGFSALLAFLHFAFFYYNPTQRANRYFARFALTVALASLLAYCAQALAFPTLIPFLVFSTLANILGAMNGLWAIRALYALFRFRPGLLYKGLWVAYGVVVVLQCVSSGSISTIAWTLLLVVNVAEQLRLTIRALRQRQRGAGLIAAGFAGGLLAELAYGSLLLYFGKLLPFNLLLILKYALLVLGFVLSALGISLYLAREFALDSQLLQVQLGEVERLSAQTIAQEQDKQALLAAQNETLEQQVTQRTSELQRSLTDLRTTQAQLIQKEKMASLGELTAGIAHEIQNPLNFVNNFSEVSAELVAELKEAQAAGDAEEVTALADDLSQNLVKITEHGRRASGIVRGMLEHSRASSGERAPTDLNALCDEYLRLAYHGLRAKDKTFNATLRTDFAPGLPLVPGVGADLGRVLLNLFTNAFYAVRKRQQAGEAGYAPTVSVSTLHRAGGQIEVRVQDNGTGIPADIQQKIFQPFFTTKPTGEGTGLGLSLSYDIVTKGHNGTLTVASKVGEGTEFIVSLPV